MSFSLQFGETHSMNAEQISQFQIDEFGNSKLPCYSDSIFAVTHYNPSTVYTFEGKTRSIAGRYEVTRFSKTNFDFPLNYPVQITTQKILAMKIKENGFSLNPLFAGYKFTTKQVRDGIWEIIKHKA